MARSWEDMTLGEVQRILQEAAHRGQDWITHKRIRTVQLLGEFAARHRHVEGCSMAGAPLDVSSCGCKRPEC